jgi:hypothetical protein
MNKRSSAIRIVPTVIGNPESQSKSRKIEMLCGKIIRIGTFTIVAEKKVRSPKPPRIKPHIASGIKVLLLV